MAPRRGAVECRRIALTFDRPVSWQAGKPIPTSELLNRLEALSSELKDLSDEQDEVHKDSLTKVAKELASKHLLGHKDKGVRAFTACCLVDVLKICAPNAPFTPSQLREIFTLFITSILPAVSNPSHAYIQQHKYVLASLAEVKSVVLICDIPNSDSLVLHLFSNFFDMISGSNGTVSSEQLPRDVEFNMTQILVILVDEAQSLPSGVIDIIVAQFLRASTPCGRKINEKSKQDRDERQSTLLLKELPPAYNMAKTICNSCPEKMARYVSQYFNEVIMEISSGVPKYNEHRAGGDAPMDSEEEDLTTGPTDADMKELQKAHNLLRELWRASPPVLQNVIPQLEHELSADDVQLRLLATETLGDIISGIGAAGPPPPPLMDPAAYPPTYLNVNSPAYISDSILTTPISPQSFAQTYPNVYRSFFSRKNDKSVVIRSAWITAIGRILTTSAGGIGLSGNEEKGYVNGLAEKLNDSDEKVRLAAVKAIGGFSLHHIMSILALNGGVSDSGSVLGSLADRARDRRHAVRSEAMKVLCRMWGVATGEILLRNERVIDTLGKIPTKIFDVYYANDPEINILIDLSIFEQLIPLTYPPIKPKSLKVVNVANGGPQTIEGEQINADETRTKRILLLVDSLESKSKKAFFAMQAAQPSYAKVLEVFLSCCENYNGGIVEKDIKVVKTKLDQPIKWFSKLLPDAVRIHHDLQKFAKLHDRRSYQLLRFAIDPRSDYNTVYKAIKEFTKRIQANQAAPAGIMETLTPIIYRSACLIYNRSNQLVFSQYARTNKHGLGSTANIIMQEISEKHPEIFQASLKELCKLIQNNAPTKTSPNDIALVDTLKSLASFTKSDGSKIPNDKNFVQALLDFSMYGTPSKAAKYAVMILAATTDRKEMHMKDLLDKSLKDWVYTTDHLLTKLAVIHQLSILTPSIIEDSNNEILKITRDLLLEVRTESTDCTLDWQEDSKLDEECQAKCYAIKILVARLQSIKDDDEAAKALAIPVFKLLNSLVIKKGEITKLGTTPKHHKARLRLLAAKQILKLCVSDKLDKFLGPNDFYNVSYLAQDPIEDVRRGFVGKLQKYLVRNVLSTRFLTIIFITAFEPSQSFRNSIMTWIRHRVKVTHDSNRGIFEAVFPRLIHLLAHHPDYSSNPNELIDHAKYILYYISTVASEENLPHIFKYAQRVKQARDALPGSDSDRLYILSDLSQALIRKWEEKKGWSMQSWPKQVGLPLGLFAALPSHEVAQQIAEKIYIPDELYPLLESLVRENDKKKQKRKPDDSLSKQTFKKLRPEKQIRTLIEKQERCAREKKTIEARKEPQVIIFVNSEDRRRSKRATNEKKIYEERESSEDDDEMCEGVSGSECYSKNGRELKGVNEKIWDKVNTSSSKRKHELERNMNPKTKYKNYGSDHESCSDEDTEKEESFEHDDSNNEDSEDEKRLQPSNKKFYLSTRDSHNGGSSAAIAMPSKSTISVVIITKSNSMQKSDDNEKKSGNNGKLVPIQIQKESDKMVLEEQSKKTQLNETTSQSIRPLRRRASSTMTAQSTFSRSNTDVEKYSSNQKTSSSVVSNKKENESNDKKYQPIKNSSPVKRNSTKNGLSKLKG